MTFVFERSGGLIWRSRVGREHPCRDRQFIERLDRIAGQVLNLDDSVRINPSQMADDGVGKSGGGGAVNSRAGIDLQYLHENSFHSPLTARSVDGQRTRMIAGMASMDAVNRG